MEIFADNNITGMFTNPHNLIMIGGLLLLLAIIYLETGFGSLAPLGYLLGNKFPGMIDYSIYFLLGFVIFASAPVIISFFKARRSNAL
jgi:hypothetical protein